MKNKIIPKYLIIIASILFACSIIVQNSTVVAQTSSNMYMQNGDQIIYNIRSTGAFIPYADYPLHVEIVSISDPNNILIDVLYIDPDNDSLTILNSSVSSGLYMFLIIIRYVITG